ncbi:MAG: hypothetical protein WKH68_12140, partial [Candidatus Limnocylindria bacterium]
EAIAEIRTTAGLGSYEATIAAKVDNGDLNEHAAFAALPGTSVDYLLVDNERADQLAIIEEVETQEPTAIATVTDTAGERYRITRRGVTLSVRDAVEILREEYEARAEVSA